MALLNKHEKKFSNNTFLYNFHILATEINYPCANCFLANVIVNLTSSLALPNCFL